jgi:integrase
MPRQRTGSLELRNGVWHVRVTVGKGDDKHREWYDLGTTDKALAVRKAARLVADIEAGKVPELVEGTGPASEKVDDYAQAYFDRREAQKVEMLRDEKMYYRTRIQEKIGGMYLCDVRPAHVRAILDDAIEAGLKRLTIVAIRSLVHRIFKAAWLAELIESNPVDRVEVPKVREVVKKRVLLTDDEFARFMAHPDVDLEIKLMGLAARTLGGMRASDLVRWDWTMIQTADFAAVLIPRSKTNKPVPLEVPEMVRPFLKLRWRERGKPESGPVFPVEKGRRAGEARKVRGTSFAERLRRNLFKAGIVRAKPVEVPYVRPGTRTDLGRKSPVATRLAPNPHDPLYNETDATMPTDFPSVRRAFSTGLARAGVNVQQAMHLAGHSDPHVHMRYVQNTEAMGRVPAAALPALPGPRISKPAAETTAGHGSVAKRGKSKNRRENHGKSRRGSSGPESDETSQKSLQNARSERIRKPQVVGPTPMGGSRKQGVSDPAPEAIATGRGESPVMKGSRAPASPPEADPSADRAKRRAAIMRALALVDDPEAIATLAQELRELRREEEAAAGVVSLDRERARR